MLNVDDACLRNNHSFIFSLFSGVHWKGNSVGRPGAGSRCGQEQVWRDSSVLRLEELTCGLLVADGKSGGRISRLKSVSQDKYMELTALLTYTMERQTCS